MPPHRQGPAGRPGPPLPSDAELLARYNLADPGTDAQKFAEVVRELAHPRKAALHCKAECLSDWYLSVRYTIWGHDSAGPEINSTDESPRAALANIIRELNKRYAARRLAAGGGR